MEMTPAENRILIRMSLSEDGVYPAFLLNRDLAGTPWTVDLRQTALNGLLAKGLIEVTTSGEYRILESGRAACVPFEQAYPGLAKLMPKKESEGD